jgi:hypothetical protein
MNVRTEHITAIQMLHVPITVRRLFVHVILATQEMGQSVKVSSLTIGGFSKPNATSKKT